MKKIMVCLAFVVLVGMTACGKSSTYKNGTFTGTYEKEDQSSRMVVQLTIEDDKITECTMMAYGRDGNLKDETYGDGLDDKNKELAKIAYQGFSQYPDLLVEKQDVNAMDAISGATVSYKEFKLAVEDALNQAK